jgi:glyoxylase-like metal-dependent hydrolase (beta-lactamase superfamily II)
MKHILPELHTFTGLQVGRVYLIEDRDGLTIIDAGIASAADRIVAQLRGAGRKPEDVKRILITHAHPDHVGGLPRLQQLTGARVYASEAEKPVVQGEIPIPRAPEHALHGIARRMRPPETRVVPTPVDQVIGEGDVLEEVMGGLHVVSTPGHAVGHLAFWQPERRILFCGDVIMRLPTLRLPVAAFTVDMDENRRSVARLQALDPAVICFGHGAPLMQRTALRLRMFASKVTERPPDP